MNFNLEELAAEVGAKTDIDAIEAMYDDADRLRSKMTERRQLMEIQTACNDVQSKLCDKIQTMKKSVVGLTQRINTLEDDDPEMFKYIRSLEFINQGIWCPKCNVQKCVGGAKPAGVGAPSYIESALESSRADCERLEKSFKMLMNDINLLRRDTEDRLSQLAAAAVEYRDQLKFARGVIAELGGTGMQVKEHAVKQEVSRQNKAAKVAEAIEVQSRVVTSTVPFIGQTIKKEDLPRNPDTDIYSILRRYDNIMPAGPSSDDLLR